MRELSDSSTPPLRLGVDLGGTKIEIAALDGQGGERLRRRIPAPRNDYAATLSAIVELVRQAEAEVGACSLGLGTPGTWSRATGLMKNCNSVWLNGRPLKTDLEAALARPIRLANDADCFALSEASDGAGADADVVFGVILGTGVGGGIVVGGRLLSGPNGIAGEWGHNPLPPFRLRGGDAAGHEEILRFRAPAHPWPSERELPGPPCYCGKRGCIETWLSGPGLAADHVRYGGEDLPAHEIAQLAAAGYEPCGATLRRYEERLARALAQVINLLDPDLIVLGGGLSNVASLYESVPRLWGRYVFSDRVDTPLKPPMHRDSSGVRGAARLWDAP